MHLREDYSSLKLEEQEMDPNPIQQFQNWFEEAIEAKVPEPNAMTLATVKPDGKPAARIVLLKGFDENGFVFFTNYNSDKGLELAHCPYAALSFWWIEQQRQIRIEGKVEKISAGDSTNYFQSRPRGSQIGAWASPQSQSIENRAVLEKNVADWEKEFKGKEKLPRPTHWGGYCLKPSSLEFWQGQQNRLHDRIKYIIQKDNSWKWVRLAP